MLCTEPFIFRMCFIFSMRFNKCSKRYVIWFYLFIYIYIEREREIVRERDSERVKKHDSDSFILLFIQHKFNKYKVKSIKFNKYRVK